MENSIGSVVLTLDKKNLTININERGHSFKFISHHEEYYHVIASLSRYRIILVKSETFL